MGDDRPTRYIEDGRIIYRASNLGACEKSLILLGRGESPAPHPDWLLQKFDEGIAGEPIVIGMIPKLEVDGAKIKLLHYGDINLPVDESGQWVVEKSMVGVTVRGHVDGIGTVSSLAIGSEFTLRERVVVEVKCCSPDYAKVVLRKLPLVYAIQISLYMHTLQMKCLLVIGIKDDDGKVVRLEGKWIHEPPLTLGQIAARIMRIEKGIKAGQIGECDYAMFPCPFYFLGCDDSRDANTTPVEMVEDKVLESLCVEYDKGRQMEKEGERKKKAAMEGIKKAMGEDDAAKGKKMEVGEWVLTQREQEMPAREAWTMRFVDVKRKKK